MIWPLTNIKLYIHVYSCLQWCTPSATVCDKCREGFRTRRECLLIFFYFFTCNKTNKNIYNIYSPLWSGLRVSDGYNAIFRMWVLVTVHCWLLWFFFWLFLVNLNYSRRVFLIGYGGRLVCKPNCLHRTRRNMDKLEGRLVQNQDYLLKLPFSGMV